MRRKTKSFTKFITQRILIIIYQIQVPLSVIVAWIMGIQMDLDFSLLETGSLAFSIIVTAFALQVLRLSINSLSISLIIMLNTVNWSVFSD
jgi:cell shape-determining protein MreD